VTLARLLLSEHKPAEGLFPTYHLPSLRAEARASYADVLDRYAHDEV
jgi:acyl-CoA dehydrogenase